MPVQQAHPLERSRRPGDLLAVMSAGAYGFTMASNYNDRRRPPEVLVDGDRYAVVRKRESYRDLVRLDDAGTEVIDTPGVRAFGLPPALDAALLPKLFPEWRGRGDCRFSDCTHREEPGCVLRTAVEEGAIAAERYASYVRLAEELAGRPARRARAKAPRR